MTKEPKDEWLPDAGKYPLPRRLLKPGRFYKERYLIRVSKKPPWFVGSG
jgi:hypothetical protein